MKKKLVFSAAAGALFLLLILALRTVDVSAIGPAGTKVGLSKLNEAFHSLTGTHFFLYDLTEWLGIAAIFVAVCFALLGLTQLIQRRSLLQVDKSILALGGLYVALAVLYVFFEKFIVNYRPVVMPGDAAPEASFPSSHTMLFCGILGSAALVAGKYVKAFDTRRILQGVCWVLVGAAVICRLLSGVHWLTDIIGGVLISAALLGVFSVILDKLQGASAAP